MDRGPATRSSGSPSGKAAAEAYSERLWRLAAMGGTMASEILAGVLLGLGLDALFKTAPVLLVIGTVLGLVVGLTTFFRRALVETRGAGREASRIAATRRLRAPIDDGRDDDAGDDEEDDDDGDEGHRGDGHDERPHEDVEGPPGRPGGREDEPR